MVQGDDQDVLLGGDFEQGDPYGRLGGEVEGAAGGLVDGGVHRLGGAVDRVHGERGVGRGEDQLPGFAVVLGDDGAQDLVAGDQVAEGELQGGRVERAGETQRERHVVEGAGSFHAVDQPEAPLGGGEREPFGAVAGGEREPGAAAVQALGETGHRRRLEHVADAELGAERRTYPAEQPGGEQRVPAEGEEVVVGRDLAGQAEHLGEQAAEDLLGGRTGGPAAGGHREVGGGQGGAVELAVDGERQRVERHEGRRDHVVGQCGGRVGAQRGRVERGARDDVGGEAGAGRAVRAVGVGQHRGLEDVGVGGEDGLDLAGFDPEAAHLDLVVGAAEVLDASVGAAPDEVAGAVHPLPRRERVGDEAFGGQRGAAEVAAGQTVAAQVQLAGDAGRHGSQSGVQDVGAEVGQRAADQGARVGVEAVVDGVDGALGGAVHVEHDGAGGGGEGGPQALAEGLAADHEEGGRTAVEQAFLDEALGLAGGGVDDVGAGGLGVADDRGGVAAHVVVEQVEFVSRDHPQQCFEGGVEGQRGDGGEPEPAAGVGLLSGGDGDVAVEGEQVGEAAVADHHALGQAGGAGGVDDVRGVGRREADGRGGGGPGRVVLGGVEDGEAVEDVGQRPAGGGEHGRRAGVGQHVGDPLPRVLGVQRKERRTRLEHGEQRDHGLRRTGHGERHHVLRTDTGGGQTVGQTVGAGVELGIGQPGVPEDQGGVVRGRGRLGGEGVRDEGAGAGPGGVVPGGELGAAGVAEDVEFGDGTVRVVGGLGEEAGQGFGEPFGGGAVEQVGGELEAALQPGRAAVRVVALGEVEGQVEGGAGQAERLVGGARAGELGAAARGVVERDHDLEQRVPCQGADRVEFLDETLERHVLVRVGGEGGLPHPGEQFGEGGPAAEVGAQHQGAGEEADELVEGGVQAAGQRGADGQVVAGAEAVQEGGVGGLEHHEEGDSVRGGQSGEPCVQFGVELQWYDVAAVARDRRARPVERQRQLVREAGQGLAPVGELAGERRCGVGVVAERPVLPEGVVGVLDGQRLPGRRLATETGGVGLGEVAEERAQRPAVAGDVVHDQQEDVLAGCVGRCRRLVPQIGVQRDVGGEVEGVADELRQRAVGDGEQRAGGGGQDALVRDAVVGSEDGAERFVAADDVVQRVLQGGRVDRAGEPEGEGDVVGGGGALGLAEEPQPALGEGDRKPLGPGFRAQGGAGRFGGEPGGEGGDGRGLEEVADGEFGAEFGARPADEAGGEEGVAAEFEEVVVDGDVVDAEDLAEECAQGVLAFVARGAARGVGGEFGGGQGAPVDLAVGVERQGGQDDDGRGDHVAGECRGGERLELGVEFGVRVGRGLGDGAVADEADVAGAVLARDDDDLADGRVAGEDGLDLAGFDPEAAQLDLAVDPAEELDRPVGPAAHQVARAVHPLPRRRGVRDEAFGGERGPVPVAAGQAGSRHVQLAGDAGRYGPEPGVEDVGAHVVERGADRRPRAGQVGGRQPVVGGEGGGLGGPVDVGEEQVGAVVEDPPHQGAGGRLAAGADGAQGAEGLGGLLGDQVEEGLGEEDGGDLVPGDDGVQGGGVRAAGRGDDDGAAGQQRGPQFVGGGVEGVRGVQQDPAVPAVLPAAVGGEVDDVAVADGDALGRAGGAGGEHHVGEPVRVDVDARVVVGRGRLVAGPDHGGGVREAGVGAVGEQDGGGGVGEQCGHPLRGQARVHRDVAAAGLEDGQGGDDQVDGAFHQERDRGLRADAGGDQVVGEPVGAGVQLGVGDGAAVVGEGRGGRGAGGLGGEQLGQRAVRDGRGGGVPVLAESVVLLGREDVEGADGRLGVGGRGGEEPAEALEEGGDGGAVVEVGSVLDGAAEAGRGAVGGAPFGDADVEVELGDAQAERLGLRLQAGQAEFALLVVLQDEQGLEQRVAAEGPDRVDLLDEPLERHVLVGEGVELGLPYAAEEFGEGRVAGGVGAQHQGVDEEADQVVERLVGAAGDAGAERDVGAGTEPGEQRGQTGLEDGEQGGAVPAGELGEGGVQLGAVVERHGVRGAGRRGRPGPVDGQLQLLRQAGQGSPPVVELTAHQTVGVGLVAEEVTLPERVVGVLHRQRLPVGGAAAEAGGVGGGEVAQQGAERPAVTGDVVEHDEQHVLRGLGGLGRVRAGSAGGGDGGCGGGRGGRCEREDRDPDGQFGGQVEGAGGGPVPQVRVVAGRAADRREGDLRLRGRQDPLHRHAVGHREHGAQGLVPGDHVGRGRAQRVEVERAAQADRERQVVERGRPFDLVDQPETLLCVRNRDHGASSAHVTAWWVVGSPQAGTAVGAVDGPAVRAAVGSTVGRQSRRSTGRPIATAIFRSPRYGSRPCAQSTLSTSITSPTCQVSRTVAAS